MAWSAGLCLPVATIAIVVGIALEVPGAEMQTLLDNPLASPYRMGVSTAAGFGAALGIVLGLQQVVFWLFGSLTRATWPKVAIIVAFLEAILPLLARDAWKLTALRIGEDRAAGLGIDVQRLKRKTVVLHDRVLLGPATSTSRPRGCAGQHRGPSPVPGARLANRLLHRRERQGDAPLADAADVGVQPGHDRGQHLPGRLSRVLGPRGKVRQQRQNLGRPALRTTRRAPRV